MVLAGSSCSKQEAVEVVADATMRCLLHVVSAAVAGIAFLSGGQSGELASARLNAMNIECKAPSSRLPWSLSFSFGRATTTSSGVLAGQRGSPRCSTKRALSSGQCTWAALSGDCDAAMERLDTLQATA